jgi:hypothetical protein
MEVLRLAGVRNLLEQQVERTGQDPQGEAEVLIGVWDHLGARAEGIWMLRRAVSMEHSSAIKRRPNICENNWSHFVGLLLFLQT